MINHEKLNKARKQLDISHPMGKSLDSYIYNLLINYGVSEPRIYNLNRLEIPHEEKSTELEFLKGGLKNFLSRHGFRGNLNDIDISNQKFYKEFVNLLKSYDALSYHISSGSGYDADIYRIANRIVDLVKKFEENTGNIAYINKPKNKAFDLSKVVEEMKLQETPNFMNMLKPSINNNLKKFMDRFSADVLKIWDDMTKYSDAKPTMKNLYNFSLRLAKARGLDRETIDSAFKQFSPNFKNIIDKDDTKTYNRNDLLKLFKLIGQEEQLNKIKDVFDDESTNDVDKTKIPDNIDIEKSEKTKPTTPQPVKNVDDLKTLIDNLPQQQKNDLITNLLKQYTDGI